MRNMYDVIAIAGGREHAVGRIRLVFAHVASSVPILEEAALQTHGVLGFPLSLRGFYASLPETREVYERLASLYSSEQLLSALSDLHDLTVLMERQLFSGELKELEKLPQYERSLFRGTTERRTLEQGPRVLAIGAGVEDIFEFALSLQLSGVSSPLTIDFGFSDEVPWKRIVVLIGKNGSGKTQTLQSIARLLSRRGALSSIAKRSRLEALSPLPLFGQVTAVSYSIYDRFPPDSYDARGKDQPYLHFGFYTRHRTISPGASMERAAFALLKIIEDTVESQYHFDEVRLSYLMEALSSCVNFNEVELTYRSDSGSVHHVVIIVDGLLANEATTLTRANVHKPSFILRQNGQEVMLSAGQTQFVLQLVVLCAFLTSRSLLLIDEPELGLHPKLEVEYIRALKRLLQRFSSYAIIATHSAIVTREVPSSQVRVLSRDADRAWSRVPTMQTLGADVTAIADEVFGDLSMEPSFERELLELASSAGSFTRFKQLYGEELSIEALSFIRNVRFGDDAGA